MALQTLVYFLIIMIDGEKLNASEDPRWNADSDWAYNNADLGDFRSSFRNSSSQSIFGRFYSYPVKKYDFLKMVPQNVQKTSAIQLWC